MRCDKNCLNCKFLRCIHDIADEKQYVKEIMLKKDRARHKEYYQENREERLAKQKEYDKKRNAERSHAFYMAHKEEINEKNRLRYAQNREKRKAQSRAHYHAHKEEISKRRKELRDANKRRESESLIG